MKRLVSKLDFAKIVNVSPAAITKACNNKLKPAFDGKRIDMNHSCVIEYMKRKEEQQSRKTTPNEKVKKVKTEDDFEDFENEPQDEYEFVKVERRKPTKTNQNESKPLYTQKGREVPEHIRKYLKYTIEDVVDEFGTEVALNDFLLANKRIEDIETARIKNDKSKGVLIEREIIEKGILNPLNSAHTRLLTDGAKSITKRVIAKYEAGLNIQELEEFVSDQMSSFLKALKQSIKRTLEELDKNVK